MPTIQGYSEDFQRHARQIGLHVPEPGEIEYRVRFEALGPIILYGDLDWIMRHFKKEVKEVMEEEHLEGEEAARVKFAILDVEEGSLGWDVIVVSFAASIAANFVYDISKQAFHRLRERWRHRNQRTRDGMKRAKATLRKREYPDGSWEVEEEYEIEF